jgi:pilus assembly protein CpaB
MRNKALIFVMGGAIFFGLIAAFSVSRFLAGARSSDSQNIVVVAKVEIPHGAKIIAEQLTTVKMPPNATPAGTFDSYDKVVGRITITRILPQEPIVAPRLAAEGTMAGLAALIPEGYRAMTVKVDDEAGLAGFLAPGTVVDVLAVISPPEQAISQNPISKIVLQNIKVLASGDNLDQPKDGREPNSVKTVTLQVTPEQAEKLVLSSAEGRLRLALRNSTDQGDEQTPGATKRTLLTGERALPVVGPDGETAQKKESTPRRRAPRPVMAELNPKAIAAPTPPPPPPRVMVEVFEGGKKRTLDFPNQQQ